VTLMDEPIEVQLPLKHSHILVKYHKLILNQYFLMATFYMKTLNIEFEATHKVNQSRHYCYVYVVSV